MSSVLAWPALADLAAKGLLLIVFAAGAALLCRRSTAAMRHWIWSLALGGLLVLPTVSIGVPSVGTLISDIVPFRSQTAQYVTTLARRAASELHESAVEPPASTDRPTQGIGGASYGLCASGLRAGRWIPKHFAAVWGAVASLFLMKLVIDIWRIVGLTRRAVPRESPEWSQRVRSLTKETGISKTIRVSISSELPTPVTWGVRRPVVLVPQAAEQWSETQLRMALIHEFAHVKRWDYVWNVVAYLSLAAHWFNPLTWFAYRRFCIERERAADDFVLRRGAYGPEYAAHLLAVVQGMPRRGRPPWPASTMARGAGLQARVKAILDDRISRSSLSRATAGITIVLTAFIVGPLAAVQPMMVPREGQVAVSVDQAIKDLSHLDPFVRMRAAWVLGEREETRAVPHLIKALGDQDSQVRALAAWGLGEIKEPTSVQALHRCLDDSDPYARQMVVLAIGEFEQARSAEVLIPLLADPSPEIRAATVWALGEIGIDDALDAVATMLADSDPRVRIQAVHGIVRKSETAPVRPSASRGVPRLLGILQNDKDACVRREVAGALGDIRDPSALSGLTAALSDPEASVRKEAAWALGRIRHPSAVNALIRSLGDTDPQVRWMAVWALDEISQQ